MNRVFVSDEDIDNVPPINHYHVCIYLVCLWGTDNLDIDQAIHVDFGNFIEAYAEIEITLNKELTPAISLK